MPDPDVTVVVAVYNGASTIGACVSSLLALRLPEERVEIVVVDNGSTDGTRDVLRAFGDRIRVVVEGARGASAARNSGVRAARGRVIAFTDADCVVEANWAPGLIAALVDPTVGIAGGPILSLTGANRIARFGERIHDHRRAIEELDLPYAMTGNWASPREVLMATGLFDEALPRGQDVDLSWRIRQAGYRLVYTPEAVVRHRNKDTVWGLLREGYAHGVQSVRVTEKHLAQWPQARRRWKHLRVRLMHDVRRIAQGGDGVNPLLKLIFDTGKTAGEMAAMTRR